MDKTRRCYIFFPGTTISRRRARESGHFSLSNENTCYRSISSPLSLSRPPAAHLSLSLSRQKYNSPIQNPSREYLIYYSTRREKRERERGICGKGTILRYKAQPINYSPRRAIVAPCRRYGGSDYTIFFLHGMLRQRKSIAREISRENCGHLTIPFYESSCSCCRIEGWFVK